MDERGFNVDDCVGSVGARIVMLLFAKGKLPLSPTEVEQSRRISNVGIHIECVIGLLRQKYTILRDIAPLDLLVNDQDGISTLDKIVHVCSALTNICPSVVPLARIRHVFYCQIYIWWFILRLHVHTNRNNMQFRQFSH